ncbi:MAG: M20 family metallopeptidase [Rhodospirillales bacterium]|nr:M20 family metallopeptidase [Rhodospirillales bacterium]
MTMPAALTALALTRQLVALNTINPPGEEELAAQALARTLEAAGARVGLYPFATGRQSLIATIGGSDEALPLAFTGHLDTVPLGAKPWRNDPFAGEIGDGRVYGRGTTDMKSGIAAFIIAVLRLAPRLTGTAGVRLILTAAEETGCEGARHMVRTGAPVGRAGALIVGEPTGNAPLVGHKGCLWLRAVAHGVTAHGSLPHLGVNAVCRAARAVTALEHFDFGQAPHPTLGGPSLNVGFLHGGLNINSVPDRAEIGLDIRTIPGQDHVALAGRLHHFLGEDITIETIEDTQGVWTEPSDAWVREVFEVATAVTGEGARVGGAPFVTDASLLTPALGGVPTVILGPGETAMAHQTDEYCRIDRLDEAVAIYEALICRWCRL